MLSLSLTNKNCVYANIASNGTLTVGVADASTNGKGLVQLAAEVASNSSTAVTTASAVKTYADTKVGDVEYFGKKDLLSTKAEIVDGVLKITEQEITWERPADNSPWNENVTKLVNNEAFAGDTKIATVETSKIKDGTFMFYNVELSEFSSDLDSLTDGDYMFLETSLETFCNDMSSLTSGYHMFSSCHNLTTFIGDLSSMTEGISMFENCTKLTTFIGDLSSLTNGHSMFSGCKQLTTFEYDLSSLTDGT